MNRAHILGFDRDIVRGRTANAVIGVLFFLLATALGAYVRIPVKGSPVPITLQTFFVMLSGAVLGKRLGVFSQLGYMILGVAGLPVFQGYAGGLAHLLGPTGGYIIGFAFASAFIGKMLEAKNDRMDFSIAVFVMGSLIIYLCGAAWLALLYKTGIAYALSMGVFPFIPGDIVKVILASIIYSGIARRAREIF